MAKCKYCSRSFSSDKALIAHMGHCKKRPQKEPKTLVSQPQNNSEPLEGPANPEHPVSLEVDEAPTADKADIGRLERIRNLLSQGYTIKELIDPPYEFPESSVYEQATKVFPPKEEARDKKHNGEDNGIPALYRKDQIINPETILRRASDGTYEDELELRGQMKLRAAMLMVMDLVNIQRGEAEADAKRFAPMLEMLKESRTELDAAAARARDSSAEIAQRAAFEVAQGMQGAFSAEMKDLKASLPGKPEEMDPMQKVFVDALRPYAAQAIGQLFASLVKKPGQGWAQPQGGPGQPAQPAARGEPARYIPPGEEDQWTEI